MLTQALLSLSLLALALMAGLFFAFSVSVMPALGAAGADVGVRGMVAINRMIMTPWFAFGFFGALVLPLLAALSGWIGGSPSAATWALAAGVIYGAGVFAVTVAVNVPLNQALAAAFDAAPDAFQRMWAAYYGPWLAWNHLRTVASVLAMGCAAVGLARG
jgi:uncharacterized membrane protein